MSNSQTTPIALITGGSRGLGRSMALQLAQRGVDVLVTYRTKAAEAGEVVSQIRALGRRAAALELDVADSSQFEPFARSVAAELARSFGRTQFDYLVNNAGNSLNASLVETTEAELDEIYRIHLKAPFLLTQRLLPLISDGGRILNVSSGLARVTMPKRAAYGTMKAAVETLTRYMAAEFAARKITVNVIAPGPIETDFSGGILRDNPEVNKRTAAHIALGRVGLPDDVGAAVSVLLSPECGWITGQRIEVSGGLVL